MNGRNSFGYSNCPLNQVFRSTAPQDEADLAWQVDWLRGEMVESEGGAVNAHLTDELTGRSW